MLAATRNENSRGAAPADSISSGGGGNRTHVPMPVHASFYVRSRSFVSRPPGPRSTGFPDGQSDCSRSRAHGPTCANQPASLRGSVPAGEGRNRVANLFRQPERSCCWQLRVPGCLKSLPGTSARHFRFPWPGRNRSPPGRRCDIRPPREDRTTSFNACSAAFRDRIHAF